MSRDRSGLDDAEIERLCESLRYHRDEVRKELSDLTGEPEEQIRSVPNSLNLSEYKEIPLEHDDDDGDDDGIQESTTVEVPSGGGIDTGGEITKTGGILA